MDMTQHSLTPDTGGATRTELVATSSSIISLEEWSRAGELALFSPSLGQSQMGTDLPSPNSPAKAGVMAWLPDPRGRLRSHLHN